MLNKATKVGLSPAVCAKIGFVRSSRVSGVPGGAKSTAYSQKSSQTLKNRIFSTWIGTGRVCTGARRLSNSKADVQERRQGTANLIRVGMFGLDLGESV